MAIKNWTITAEGTKSASAREYYFHDKKNKNHKHTTGYLDIYGSPETTLNIIGNCERHKLKTALKAKGGRPPNEAAEFVLTLPKGLVRPTQSQWRAILVRVMNDIAPGLDVKAGSLRAICRAVAHQQDENVKNGSGDHMHVMIGKFTDKGVYLRKLQSKSTLYQMKKSFNVAALEVLGINHATYEPVKAYKGVAKKRVPKWRADAGKEWDKLKIMAERVNKANKDVDSKTEANMELERSFNKFFDQADKWLKAFKEQDVKQMNRQHNRLGTTIGDLNALTVSEESRSLTDSIQAQIKRIESRSDQQLPEFKPSFRRPTM